MDDSLFMSEHDGVLACPVPADTPERISSPVVVDYQRCLFPQANDSEKDMFFLAGYPDAAQKGSYVAGFAITFTDMPAGASVKEFRDRLEKAVAEPWFIGRMTEAAQLAKDNEKGLLDRVPQDTKERVVADFKEAVSRLLFEKEQFIRELSGERTKLDKEPVKTGTAWIMNRTACLADGKVSEQRFSYPSYEDAKDELVRFFKNDMERYGKYLADGEGKTVVNSFFASLHDPVVRHPHYGMEGTYTDRRKVLTSFSIKAEVYGERILTSKRSQLKKKANEWTLAIPMPPKPETSKRPVKKPKDFEMDDR